MKTLLMFATLLAATPALAREVVCFDRGNSDYQVTLNLDAQGALSTIAYSNMDWGAAGMGDLQAVKNLAPNIYQVVTAPQSMVGVQIGARVELRLDTSSRLQEVLISQSGAEAQFHCN